MRAHGEEFKALYSSAEIAQGAGAREQEFIAMTKYSACIGTPPPFSEFGYLISKIASNVNEWVKMFLL